MKKTVSVFVIVFFSSILVLSIVLGYLYELNWVGVIDTATGEIKSLWDWLELLIVPLILAIGGWWISHVEKLRSQNLKDTEVLVLVEKQRQDSLQKYIDDMTSLLLGNITDEWDEDDIILNAVIISQTLATLKMLDGTRKGILLQFLCDLGLISIEKNPQTQHFGSLDIRMADLSNANLNGCRLYGVRLMEVNFSGATFYSATFYGSDLWQSNFTAADLTYSEFISARMVDSTFQDTKMIRSNASDLVLTRAKISNSVFNNSLLHEASFKNAKIAQTAFAHCILNGADFSDATLNKVDFSNADLSPWVEGKRTSFRNSKLVDVNFDNADLTGADFTDAQIDLRSIKKAKTLTGVILPNGNALAEN